MKIKLKIDHKLGKIGDVIDVQPAIADAFLRHDQAEVLTKGKKAKPVVKDVVEEDKPEEKKARRKRGKQEVETAETVDKVEER